MGRPDVNAAAERFAALPLLPRSKGGPVFVEPWQAQAFAMAVQLSASLSAEIARCWTMGCIARLH